MEPLQGEGGIKPGAKEFFAEIRKLCDQTGALMMVDEVQTGIGRTGKLWGYQNLDIEPDVITSAKVRYFLFLVQNARAHLQPSSTRNG
jgi:acetylornithine aminotransferase